MTLSSSASPSSLSWSSALPISFAVGVASVIATFLLPGVDNATIVQRMLTAINTFPLLAVIFFVFAGVLMARGGIARVSC